jgi:hypothetical protein
MPVCDRDRAPTRLTCAGCGAAICPRCMSRTAVGFKCENCAGTGATAPGRRRPPAWVAVPALVALVVVAVALRPDGGDAGDPLGVPAAQEQAPAGQAMLGEEANDGQVTFVVTDFSCGEKAIGARTAEGKFCRLHLRAHNRSGGPALVLSRFQYLLDGRSKTYGSDLALSQDVPENGGRPLSELNVNPDLTVDFVLLYDVPESLDPLEAQLRGTGAGRFGVRVRLQRRAD